ncbi:MAG: CapA family protein [Chloroflexi bacterium]|nr:CapA family protein [Chloroflexota bacterium]
MAKSVMNLVAVGDVHPNREDPKTLFGLVADVLKQGDVTLCQLECTLSDKGTVRTDVRNPTHRVPPKNIDALTAGGFNVVTFAGNNNLDYGLDAFFDTLARLEQAGIKTVGAGRNLEEARRPLFVEKNGVRIAFVNACSIVRDGYEATAQRPGIAPLRVKTFYEPLENIYEQPGTPARTVTVVDVDDLDAVCESIRAAKREAHVVLGCFHWGVHFTYDLAMYQPDIAYAAIDAGADLILGTHPHCPQAIDVYKGKAIFYSLSNFAFEMPERAAKVGVGEYLSFYGIPLDREVPTHPHPSHCRRSVIVKARISRDGIERVAFIPSLFNLQALPEIQKPGTAGYQEIKQLLEKLSRPLATELAEENGEFVVQPEKGEAVDTRRLLRHRRISYSSLSELATQPV